VPQKRGALTGHRFALVASVFAIILVPVYFGWRATGFDDASGAAGVTARVANSPAGTASMTFMAATGSSGPPPEVAAPDPTDVARSRSLAGAAGQTSVVRLNTAAAGHTVTLQVGQQLVVTLGPGWSRPRAQTPPSDAGSAIQPLRAAPAGPADPSASTVFTAVRVGHALVVAQGSAGSRYGVMVVVQPAPGQRAGPLPKSPIP